MNIKLLIAKALKILLNPPALRNCSIDKTAKVCAKSNLNTVKIGRYSYIGYDVFGSNVDIGSFVSIGDRVCIGGAQHPIDRVSMSPVFHAGDNVLKTNFYNHPAIETPITIIENDVWIGMGAFIKGGVHISTGSVIGMGSVVTHNIPPYEIWAGNPAKLIRKRFDDVTIQKLLQSEWWSYSKKDLEKCSYSFNSPSAFLELDNSHL